MKLGRYRNVVTNVSLLLAASACGGNNSEPADAVGAVEQTISTPLVTDDYFEIPATTNIFEAGTKGGNAPTAIPLAPGTDRVIEFSVATAKIGTLVQGHLVSCCGVTGPHTADGGTNLNTHINSANGISGIAHTSKNMFLLGAFLSGDLAPSTPAPTTLEYYSPADDKSPPPGALSDQGRSFTPALQQAFFIGDGLTGNNPNSDALDSTTDVPPSGSIQRFHVPDGATHLYLGFADGLNLGDSGYGGPVDPGYYGDNTGTVAVRVREVDAHCCDIQAAAQLISARALSSDPYATQHFTRQEILTVAKAVECRTGVPDKLLKAIAYSEGFASAYQERYPRQYLEPLEGQQPLPTTLPGWSALDLTSRFLGGNFFTLLFHRAPARRYGVIARDPGGLTCVSNNNDPALSALKPGQWLGWWPSMVHVTLGDDRPSSQSFGLGIMQVTLAIDQLPAPYTVVGECPRQVAAIQPIGTGAGKIDEHEAWTVFPIGPDDVDDLIRDPYSNMLVGAELALFAAQMKLGVPFPYAKALVQRIADGDDTYLHTGIKAPKASDLIANSFFGDTEKGWGYIGAEYKTSKGDFAQTEAWLNEVMSGTPPSNDADGTASIAFASDQPQNVPHDAACD